MHSSQASFCELFELILAEESRPLYEHVLAPWLATHADELEWLRNFALRRGEPIPPANVEDLWRLYSLGRVNENLLLAFQSGRSDRCDWPGPKITLDDYLRFAESLGLVAIRPTAFSPFYHEIAVVEEASDEDQPVEVVSTVWPCFMLGDMLFSRAGVRISAGRRIIRKDVAESSTLYWAYRRKNRPYQDLSEGWGSNSQLRTCFRRDYRIGEVFHYNVDGQQDLAASGVKLVERNGLTRAERVELLTHRCFVKTTKPHSEWWPYDDTICATAGDV